MGLPRGEKGGEVKAKNFRTLLNIIDEHELLYWRRHGTLDLFGECSCGEFKTSTGGDCSSPRERLIDEHLKHVQQVRDAMRGGDHV